MHIYVDNSDGFGPVVDMYTTTGQWLIELALSLDEQATTTTSNNNNNNKSYLDQLVYDTLAPNLHNAESALRWGMLPYCCNRMKETATLIILEQMNKQHSNF